MHSGVAKSLDARAGRVSGILEAGRMFGGMRPAADLYRVDGMQRDPAFVDAAGRADGAMLPGQAACRWLEEIWRPSAVSGAGGARG